MRAGGHGDFIEHFRISSDGQVADTQYDLVSREEAEQRRNEQTQLTTNEPNFGWFSGQQPGWGRPAPPAPSFFAPWGEQPRTTTAAAPSARPICAVGQSGLSTLTATTARCLITSGADVSN